MIIPQSPKAVKKEITSQKVKNSPRIQTPKREVISKKINKKYTFNDRNETTTFKEDSDVTEK